MWLHGCQCDVVASHGVVASFHGVVALLHHCVGHCCMLLFKLFLILSFGWVICCFVSLHCDLWFVLCVMFFACVLFSPVQICLLQLQYH